MLFGKIMYLLSKMKTERVYLAELNNNSRSYTVRVDLIRKGPAQERTGEPVKHQVLLLRDDQGNTAKGMLCGKTPQAQKDRLQVGGSYDITDAKVVWNYGPWYSGPSELGITLYLDSNTVIVPAYPQTMPENIDYRCISDLREGGVVLETVGVVLYVEPNHRMVTMAGGSRHAVRDIVLTDASSAIPIFITTFDELAHNGSPLVSNGLNEFPVVGLAGLLTAYYKGFSLATGFITTVTTYPLGPKADALRDWVVNNREELVGRAEQLLTSISPYTPKAVCQIEDCLEKTIYGLQLGDRHWVRGSVHPLTPNQISAYTGCSECEGPTNVQVGCDYFCIFCVSDNRTSSCCIKVEFCLLDSSGSIPLTARTEHAELLLRTPAPDVYRLKHNGDESGIQNIVDKLGASTLWFELTAARMNRGTPLIFWELTRIEIPVVHLPTNFTLTPRGAQKYITNYQDYMEKAGTTSGNEGAEEVYRNV